MNNEAIANYVRDERARGVADSSIRAELGLKGWKREDIDAVIPAGEADQSISMMNIFGLQFLGAPQTVAWRLLLVGFALFLVSSATLVVLGAGRDLENRLVFAAFSLTHIVNCAAAFFLFLSVWNLSRSIWFRIWVGVMALAVALFALSSLVHFLSLATGLSFFNELQRALLGDDYLPLIIYFFLLPLQAIVFLLMAITLWVLKFLRRRSTGSVLLLRKHLETTGLFFLMALLALGDLYLVLSGFRW